MKAAFRLLVDALCVLVIVAICFWILALQPFEGNEK
jgi:hypothetical protein